MNTIKRQFDLNIEKVLEHWTMAHAVRELIANALDEQAITGTEEPLVSQDHNGDWHIRDFGRGLRYEHLTQNESEEKLKYPGMVIGKFGVGLKDALATADRNGVSINIRSRHGDVSIHKMEKHGFSDITTLHAEIGPPTDPAIVGTDFILSGVSAGDITQAKRFFLRYTGDVVLEETRYGTVLGRNGANARIYVNGLCVAEEENFLFSYNITVVTSNLLKALNRERTNVGRSAYTDRVKAILLECTSSNVVKALAEDLRQAQTGAVHDELQWQDVSLHACRILNASEKVVFVTSAQLLAGGSHTWHAQADGYSVVVVPDTVAAKLPTVRDIVGDPVCDLTGYVEQWNDSFEFKLVSRDELNSGERKVFNLTGRILDMVGRHHSQRVKEIVISETMRLNSRGDSEVVGLWQSAERRIIIHRNQLRTVKEYASTLLHEVAHASTGADDVSECFEQGLTEILGVAAAAAISGIQESVNSTGVEGTLRAFPVVVEATNFAPGDAYIPEPNFAESPDTMTLRSSIYNALKAGILTTQEQSRLRTLRQKLRIDRDVANQIHREVQLQIVVEKGDLVEVKSMLEKDRNLADAGDTEFGTVLRRAQSSGGKMEQLFVSYVVSQY